jgi:hypothetical protein
MLKLTQPKGCGYKMGGLPFLKDSVGAGFSLRTEKTQPEGCGYHRGLLKCVMLL